MTAYIAISDKLKAVLPDLPKALKVAATYMLEHPGDVATLSMRQVAANAGVSLPNFARLAKLLGYETYGELREIYRKQVQRGDIQEYYLRAESLQKSAATEGMQKIWSEFQHSAVNNVQQLFDSASIEQIQRVAADLSACRRIYLVGMQASYSMASYAKYLGGMISDQFRVIDNPGSIYADDIADLGESDALLAISSQPCARVTIEVAEIARERDAHIVGLVDSPASPLALLSDQVLLCPNGGPLYFESYVTTTLIIEMLMGFLALQHSTSAVKRIEKIDADRVRLGEYWKDKEL